MAEFNSPINEETPLEWALSIDYASNVKGNGVGIVLEGPGNILIEKASKFEFTVKRN